MPDAEFELKDNSPQVLNEFSRKLEAALKSCGILAERFAVLKADSYEWTNWSTGLTVEKIKSEVEVDGTEGKMVVGTTTSYAPYIEFGTGIHYAGGRTTPWMFEGPDGKKHWTRGMKPRPFIKPAIADHKSDYAARLKKYLSDE